MRAIDADHDDQNPRPLGEPQTDNLRPQLQHAAAAGEATGGASAQGGAIDSLCGLEPRVLDDFGPLPGLSLDKSAEMFRGVARQSEALIGELLVDRWIGHRLVC